MASFMMEMFLGKPLLSIKCQIVSHLALICVFDVQMMFERIIFNYMMNVQYEHEWNENYLVYLRW